MKFPPLWLVGLLLLVGQGNVAAAAAPHWAKPGRGAIFRDCVACPEMIVVHGGSFVIGSPDTEAGRGVDEGPRRRVHVASIAVSRFEITRREYASFLASTHREVKGGCMTDRRHSGEWAPDEETDFHDPGFRQSDNHPAACVSWYDARAYAEWLSSITGSHYRLLTEAEWEYLARAGSTSAYPWGAKAERGCTSANGFDRFAMKLKGNLYQDEAIPFAACTDGFLNTAPVGSFAPNRFGIFDMIGNLGEWLEDCATPSYAGMRDDGSQPSADCSMRMVRGGSWGTMPRQLRTAERIRYAPDALDDSIGIRVAKDIAATGESSR